MKKSFFFSHFFLVFLTKQMKKWNKSPLWFMFSTWDIIYHHHHHHHVIGIKSVRLSSPRCLQGKELRKRNTIFAFYFKRKYKYATEWKDKKKGSKFLSIFFLSSSALRNLHAKIKRMKIVMDSFSHPGNLISSSSGCDISHPQINPRVVLWINHEWTSYKST